MNAPGPASANKAFTQHDAEQMMRSLWVVFNNMGLYKLTHPLTSRALAELHTLLSNSLPQGESVSIFIEHGALVCEEWVISPKFYGDRMLARFKDAGIQSITIAGGVTATEIEELAAALCAPKELPTVDDIARHLKERSVRSLRFNYITYQKVTADESIVRQDLRRLAELFTTATAVHDVGEAKDNLIGVPSHVGRESSASLAARLKMVREMIASDALPSGGKYPSPQELAEVLQNLRKNALDTLQANLLEGSLDESQETVMDELERLTCEAVMRIVKEEYRRGAIAVERLADIIERLVPEKRTLRRLLPMLKKTLIDEGMPLEDYLKLMKELLAKTNHQDLLAIFEEEGSRIGVSIDEIVGGIRHNPEAAVRMLVLAAELDSLAGFKKGAFENLLADYITQVYEKYAATERLATAHERELAIQRLEQELLERFAQAGFAPQTIAGVRTLLLKESAGKAEAARDGAAADASPGEGGHANVSTFASNDAAAGGRPALVAAPSEQSAAAESGHATAVSQPLGGSAGRREAAEGNCRAEQGLADSVAAAKLRPALMSLAAELGGLIPSSEPVTAQIASFLSAVAAANAPAPGAPAMDDLLRQFSTVLGEAGIPHDRLAPASEAVLRALRKAYESTSAEIEFGDTAAHSNDSLLAAIAGAVTVARGETAGGSSASKRLEQILAGIDPAQFRGFLELASEIGAMTGAREQVRAVVEQYLHQIAKEGVAPGDDWLSAQLGGAGMDTAESAALAQRLAHAVRSMMRRAAEAGIIPAAESNPMPQEDAFEVAIAHIAASDSRERGNFAGQDIPGAGPRRKPAIALPAGILKSRQIKAAVHAELVRHRRYGTPFSAICCSLTGTAGVNAKTGREDAMIEQARLLLGRIRELDRVGIMGALSSGLFLILLPNTDEQGAQQTIARLRDLGQADPLDGGAQAWTPVYSICAPADQRDEDALNFLARARAEHRRSVKAWQGASHEQ